MKNKQNSFIAGILAAGMFLSSAAFVSAENTSSSAPQLSALTQQVQDLLAQIQVLQAKLVDTKKEVASVKQELALTRALAIGSTGKDVSGLQEYLKDFPEIYPEGLVTGYFGHATEKAVKRLQEKQGLEQAGIVGPKTREKLRSLFSEQRKGGKGFSVKHEEGNNENDSDRVSSSTAGTAKVVVCHKKEKKHGGETITIGTPALHAHLAHGDTLGACGGLERGTGTTTPDTTTPAISNIVSSALTTTAGIVWDTNENATYEFWYGTTTPVIFGTPNMTGGLNTHQAIGISGLSPDTTYYFAIAAKDTSGNISTSTERSFKTLADTFAPVISGLSISNITTTGGATILWNTNEIADGTVWYSAVNPVGTTASSVTNATLSLAHSLSLTGLTASTTYYYFVGAKDVVGNLATSSQASFLTI